MLRNVAVLLVLFISLFLAAQASAELKEGLWEYTMKAEMKGMPSSNMPPHTVKQCVTKDNMVPKPKQQPGQECKMKEQKVVGNTVTYAMECKNKDGSTMDTKGRMTYKGTSFDGQSTTVMKGMGEAGTMEVTNKMTGKYLGPCTK